MTDAAISTSITPAVEHKSTDYHLCEKALLIIHVDAKAYDNAQIADAPLAPFVHCPIPTDGIGANEMVDGTRLLDGLHGTIRKFLSKNDKRDEDVENLWKRVQAQGGLGVVSSVEKISLEARQRMTKPVFVAIAHAHGPALDNPDKFRLRHAMVVLVKNRLKNADEPTIEQCTAFEKARLRYLDTCLATEGCARGQKHVDSAYAEMVTTAGENKQLCADLPKKIILRDTWFSV